MAQEGIENIRSRLNRLGVPQPVIDNHITAVRQWRDAHPPRRVRLSFDEIYAIELFDKRKAARTRAKSATRSKRNGHDTPEVA
jgi:hypothetical protein